MKKLTILCILFVSIGKLFSQPAVNFLPVNEYFFTTDQIWNFNILNTGKQSLSATLELSLMRNGTATVMTSKLINFEIPKGMSIISNAQKMIALTTYGNDASSQSFQNTGILSPGNYTICVTIKNAINQPVTYSCRELHVNSFTLPVLTFPLNESTIYNGYPMLTWLPVMPTTIPGLTYKLELWKTGRGNNFKETGNLFETTINENNLQYYAGLPLLETGKSYSWKVSAYAQDFYLGCSDIWEFTVNTTANAKVTEEEADSYRIIDNESNNAQYTANNILRIKYQNIANDSILTYSITLLDNPEIYISELPEVLLSKGLNKIDIDLATLETLELDTYYLLEIEDANGRNYFLRFLYTEL